MQRAGKMQESPRYEMTSVDGNPLWRNVTTESITSGKGTNSPKPKTKPGSGEQTHREKIVEIRHCDMNHDGGVYEVIANNSKGAPQDGKERQRTGGESGDVVFDSLNIMTQATQQQMDLFRRMMYLITMLLVIVFLIAAASLALTVMIMMSGNTLRWNQPTSSPGRFPCSNDI